MRLTKKLSLVFLAAAGILAFGLAAAAVLVVARPEWFLTANVVSRAVRVFAPAFHARSKTFAFGIRSTTFADKEVSLRAGNLCFVSADAGLEGCFKELDIQLGIRLYFFGAKLTKISRLVVSGDHLSLDQTKGKPDGRKAKGAGLPTSLSSFVPAAVRGIKIEVLRLDLPAVEIIQSSGTIRGDIRWSFDPAVRKPMLLKLKLEQTSGKTRNRYDGEASLESDLLSGKPLTFLDAKGRLNAPGVRATFEARARQKGRDGLAFKLTASARVPGRRVEAGLEGLQAGQRFKMNGKAEVWEDSGPIKSLKLKPFTIDARLKRDSTDWERIQFDGRFDLEPLSFRGRSPLRSLAQSLQGRISIDARSTPRTLENDHFDADISVVIKPIIDWYEFRGSFEAKVSGRASQVQKLDITDKLDVGLKVAKFENLVEFLSHTPYAVPAPFYVLKGPLSATAKGGGGVHDEQNLDYELVSGLAAGRQSLKFDAKGKLAVMDAWAPGRSLTDETTLTVQDVALQLPRLDVKGMATFTGDRRIKNGADSDKENRAEAEERRHPASSTATPVAVDLLVRTAKPILIYSNLAKDPVPIAVEMRLKSPPVGLTGTLEVRPFRVDIFRRTASIDHIKLTGLAGSTNMALDGLIVYRSGESKIFIRLLGTAQKPRVEFESDPPMNQADILAMLLFGKSPDELDSDQQSSVANAQTALSNRAFGLASLYLLASTPVEYVGYDPVSRTYTVKFRLPGGATLQLGSDGRSKGVQLRKRIASHLAIQSELTNSQTQGSVVTTFLEWFGRH